MPWFFFRYIELRKVKGKKFYKQLYLLLSIVYVVLD